MQLYQPTITGSLSVSGSINTTGTITATTLVVQTVTSSVSYLTGSTQFGSLSSNTHTFTGSVLVSGSIGVGINNPSAYGALAVSGAVTNSIARIALSAIGTSNGINLGDDGTDAVIGTLNSATKLHILSRSGGVYSRAVTVDSAGFVGIGTTSPVEILHITASNSPAIRIGGVRSYLLQTVDSDGRFRIHDNTGGERFSIASGSGYIGINTTTPGATLPSGIGWTNTPSKVRIMQINSTDGNANSGLFLRQTDNSTGLDLWADNYYGNGYIDSRWDNIDGSLYFRVRTAGTPIIGMKIYGNGNVIVGNSSTSTSAKLQVFSTDLATPTTNSSFGGIFVQGGSYTSTQVQAIDFGSTTYNKPLTRISTKIASSGTYLYFSTSNDYSTGITNTALVIDPTGFVGNVNRKATIKDI